MDHRTGTGRDDGPVRIFVSKVVRLAVFSVKGDSPIFVDTKIGTVPDDLILDQML